MSWCYLPTEFLVRYTNGYSLFIINRNGLLISSTIPKIGSVPCTVTHLSTAWHYTFKTQGLKFSYGFVQHHSDVSILKYHIVKFSSVSEDWGECQWIGLNVLWEYPALASYWDRSLWYNLPCDVWQSLFLF